MLTWVFNSKSNLFEICQQNLTTNLARNSSSDKVGAKSNIGRVSKTGKGGGHSVDWVGCGKSTKVVKLEELGLRLPLAINNGVVVSKRQTRHPQSSSIGGRGDNTTSSVSSENLANGVGLSLCLPLAVNNRGGITEDHH